MGNVGGAFQWLISTLFDIFAFIVMLRFIMQFTRASFSNPIGELIVQATSPLLKPLRKIIPGLGGHDIAALVLVFLILLAKFLLFSVLGWVPYQATIPLALMGVLGTALDVFLIAILVLVILSWVSPGGHPLSGMLRSVTSPILTPMQRIIPPFNGLDLSPLVAMLILYFLKIALGV